MISHTKRELKNEVIWISSDFEIIRTANVWFVVQVVVQLFLLSINKCVSQYVYHSQLLDRQERRKKRRFNFHGHLGSPKSHYRLFQTTWQIAPDASSGMSLWRMQGECMVSYILHCDFVFGTYRVELFWH